MLRDAGTTSNRRSKNRPGAAGLWGGGHGWRRWPIRTGYMRWWNHRPTNDSLPSGGFWYDTVRYGNIYYEDSAHLGLNIVYSTEFNSISYSNIERVMDWILCTEYILLNPNRPRRRTDGDLDFVFEGSSSPAKRIQWLSGGSPGPWNHVFLSPSTGHQSNSLLRKW